MVNFIVVLRRHDFVPLLKNRVPTIVLHGAVSSPGLWRLHRCASPRAEAQTRPQVKMSQIPWAQNKNDQARGHGGPQFLRLSFHHLLDSQHRHDILFHCRSQTCPRLRDWHAILYLWNTDLAFMTTGNVCADDLQVCRYGLSTSASFDTPFITNTPPPQFDSLT